MQGSIKLQAIINYGNSCFTILHCPLQCKLNVQIVCKTPMNVQTPKLQITNSSLLSNNVYVEYENKLKQNQ